jgi:Ca2+:H+ antiporter
MDSYSAFAWLAMVTGVTAVCADVLVASIDETAEQWHLPKASVTRFSLGTLGTCTNEPICILFT